MIIERYNFFASNWYIYSMSICRDPSPSSFFAKLVNPLICFAIGLWLLYVGQGVLKSFVFSCLLALLLTSVSVFFEKQGFPRGFAAMIALLLALIVFLIVFYFISNSIISFQNDLPLMIQNIQDALAQLAGWIKGKFHLSPQKMKEIVNSSTAKVLPQTSLIVNTAVSTISNTLFTIVFIFIQTFLLLLYRGLIVRFFVSLFAEIHTQRVYHVVAQIRFVIRSYIVGLFIEMIIVATAYSTALFIIGVKYALLLGIIGAILNIIPYLGIFIACILSSLITFTTGGPDKVVWIVLTLLIIHVIDSNILLPKIVGSKVKINALTTIFGVIAGSALWGIPGTFLAVPIMAIMKVVFEEIEAFHSFAVLMGDDAEVKSMTKPVLKKIANSVRRKPKK